MMGGKLFGSGLPAKGDWTVLRLTGGDSALVYFTDDAGTYAGVMMAASSHAWVLYWLGACLELVGHAGEHWENLLICAEARVGRRRKKFLRILQTDALGGVRREG